MAAQKWALGSQNKNRFPLFATKMAKKGSGMEDARFARARFDPRFARFPKRRSGEEEQRLVALGATPGGNGAVATFSPEGKTLVAVGAHNGNGVVWTTNKSGRRKILD